MVGACTRAHFRLLQEKLYYPAFPGCTPIQESKRLRRFSKYLHFLGRLSTRGLTLDTFCPPFTRNGYLHVTDHYIASVVPDALWKAARKQLVSKNILFLSQLRSREGNVYRLDLGVVRLFAPDPKWLVDIRNYLTIGAARVLKPELFGSRRPLDPRPLRRPHILYPTSSLSA